MNGTIARKLREIEILLDSTNLAKQGADYMRSITPIDKGNARRNTFSQGTDIIANYPYAQRLDEGWSKQNTTGLIDPTMQYISDLISKGVK